MMGPSPVCIYCGNRGVMSKEHVLPACLGTFRSSERLRDRVCQSCNEEIGKLEDQFCHSGEPALFRQIVGVRGRKRKTKISPFERGSAGAPRAEILLRDPDENDDLEVLWEPIWGMKSIKPVRQVIVRDNETGRTHRVPIPMRGGSAPYVRRYLREQERVTDFRALKAYCEPEERHQLERMMRQLGAREFRRSLRTRGPLRITVVVTSTITDKYCRSIAKILFHYFLREYPRLSGADPAFSPIRTFIMQGGNVDDFVRMDTQPITYDTPPGVTPSRWLHILIVDKDYLLIRGKACFFLGPGYTPPTWHVRIGANPERVHTAHPEGSGHQFVYLGNEAPQGYDGEMQELHKFSRLLLP